MIAYVCDVIRWSRESFLSVCWKPPIIYGDLCDGWLMTFLTVRQFGKSLKFSLVFPAAFSVCVDDHIQCEHDAGRAAATRTTTTTCTALSFGEHARKRYTQKTNYSCPTVVNLSRIHINRLRVCLHGAWWCGRTKLPRCSGNWRFCAMRVAIIRVIILTWRWSWSASLSNVVARFGRPLSMFRVDVPPVLGGCFQWGERILSKSILSLSLIWKCVVQFDGT